MKKLLFLIILLASSCAKYQVVSEIRINCYHLHSPKYGTEIILTNQDLEVGGWYRLNRLDVTTVNEIKPTKLRKLTKVKKWNYLFPLANLKNPP